MEFQIIQLADARAERERSGRLSHEFLRVPALSATIYELGAGSDDPQQPHAEDEIYYVVAGRAKFDVRGEQRPVREGEFIYVAAEVPHRFVEIEEDLTLLVLFAPAKTR